MLLGQKSYNTLTSKPPRYVLYANYVCKQTRNKPSPHGPSRHARSRLGGGRRCAGARGAARARLAQRAAAVLLLHGTVRLQQRAEVDRGAVRAVGVRAVLAISQLELQPEQPG